MHLFDHLEQTTEGSLIRQIKKIIVLERNENIHHRSNATKTLIALPWRATNFGEPCLQINTDISNLSVDDL